MRTIATLQEPEEGSIRLGDPSAGSEQGIDVLNQKDELRKTLGYLPQEFGVYPKVTAAEMISSPCCCQNVAAVFMASRQRY